MMWYELICSVFLLMIKNEAVGWVILLLMVAPPLCKLGFAWSAVMDRETRRCGYCIDEDGFYDVKETSKW